MKLQPQELPVRLGDTQWRGVMMRSTPHAIPAGYAAEAQNLRFRKGIPSVRKGCAKLPWTNYISGGGVYPWGAIYGVGEFRDPRSQRLYLLVASARGVYACFPNNPPMPITLPAGHTVTAKCTFLHGPSVVIMLRGSSAEPLAMADIYTGFTTIAKVDDWPVVADPDTNRIELADHFLIPGDLVEFTGTSMPGGLTASTPYYVLDVVDKDHFTLSTTPFLTSEVDITSAATAVTMNVIDGTEPIPFALRGFFAANRLFVQKDDVIYASDPLDYGRYSVFNSMRLHQGGSELLQTTAMFGKSEAVALKEHSVLKLTGLYGDLADVRQAEVTRRYGNVAPESAVDAGTDFLWLSQNGVASLSLTEFGEVQASQGAIAGKPPMFSDDIQPLIDRINWTYAPTAVAEIWDNAYYLAVPLDDGEVVGEELVHSGYEYGSLPAIGNLRVPTIAGRSYRYTFGPTDTSLVNGTQTVVATTSKAGLIVAQSSSVTFKTPSPTTPAGGSLREVRRGVNNAIIRYDFTNAAWSGYDVLGGLDVAGFKKFICGDQERLFLWTQEGYIFLYEEGYEDQLPQPTLTLGASIKPTAGNTVAVNGGTTITANSLSGNLATQWGASTLLRAQANLHGDYYSGGYGFGIAMFNTWSAPNTSAVPYIDPTYGAMVKFTATNGLLPTVAYTGTWPVIYEQTTQPVVASLVTRGVELPGEWMRSSWVTVDVETWNPSTTYELLTEGVNESHTLVSARTKSRTTFTRPWNAPAWTSTNANDDAMDPYREDYSVALGAATLPTLLCGSGVVVDQHQFARERFYTHHSGGGSRLVQLRITNTQGRVNVLGWNITATTRHLPAGSTN
jgi:hypothetical protein